MSIGFILYLVAPKAAYRRAASPWLKVHFPEEWTQVWRLTCTWQSRLAPSRPRHSTNVNIMMRYMEWNCALYRALQEHGMSQTKACELVEVIGSDLYRPVPAALFKISRLRSAKQETRVKWLFGLLTRYFFSSPFHHRHLPAESGVSFDVTFCPLANYFKDQGVPELTPYAACNTDYLLGQEFGVDLIRSQTIVDGSEYCDFRWKFQHTKRNTKRQTVVSD